MTDDSRISLDTKEFVAGWQSIVEDHVVQDLIGALRRLSAPESGGPEELARHLTHAFQVAAAPSGGVQAAVQYLCDMAQQARPNGAT
jgi:hypothetical protein